MSFVAQRHSWLPKTMTHSLLRDDDRLVCLGDSLTADPEGYVTIAREVLRRTHPGVAVINAGAPGNTARDMLARFERDVLARKPTWVTLSAGMNDAARGLTLAGYRTAMTDLLEAGAGAGLRLALCTTTGFEPHWQGGNVEGANSRLGEYDAWLEQAAAERGLLLIPMHRMVQQAQTLGDDGFRLTSDGVHMAPAGRYLMALTFLAAFGVSLPSEVPASP